MPNGVVYENFLAKPYKYPIFPEGGVAPLWIAQRGAPPPFEYAPVYSVHEQRRVNRYDAVSLPETDFTIHSRNSGRWTAYPSLTFQIN